MVNGNTPIPVVIWWNAGHVLPVPVYLRAVKKQTISWTHSFAQFQMICLTATMLNCSREAKYSRKPTSACGVHGPPVSRMQAPQQKQHMIHVIFAFETFPGNVFLPHFSPERNKELVIHENHQCEEFDSFSPLCCTRI